MNTFNKLLLSVFLSLVFIGANAQTTVPQIISGSTTWTAAGSPYIVTQNVLIKSGSTVRVQPGTKIRGTGNFKIIMEAGAGFEARGKKDSVISIDTVNFDYMKGSIGYDFTTNSGAVFSYCFFRGTGMGGVITINLSETPLLISNCRFWNTYYTIYGINANTNTVKVRIEKSLFEGANGNGGYVIMPNGSKTELEMDECIVKYTYGMYLAATSTITRCLFYNWISYSGFVTTWSKKATFKCNVFKKFRSSIIEFGSANPANTEIIVVSNTFDSAEYHIDYRVNSVAPYAKFVCKNNNFLYYSKNSIKIGGGSKPGYADTLVFTKNYWGTTSTAKITAGIWDINDDITIAGLVDYANFLTAMNNDCIEEESEESFVGNSASTKEIRNIGLSIYPNPANGFISINSSNFNLKSWKIYSLTGELVKVGQFNNQNQLIDIAGLGNGFFFVEVGDGQTFSGKQKFVISR